MNQAKPEPQQNMKSYSQKHLVPICPRQNGVDVEMVSMVAGYVITEDKKKS